MGKALQLRLVAAVLALGAAPALAQIELRAYATGTYSVDSTGGAVTNGFGVPEMEFFLSADSGRLRFLTEVMFELDGNSIQADVERLEVAYLIHEMLRVRFGRFHGALGYYNDAYHHGRYYMVAQDRPRLFAFEDHGGLLPVHTVGLHVDGRLPLWAAGKLRYDVEVGNGRGTLAEEVAQLTDPNNQKAVNVRLRYEPAFVEDLVVGANLYFDFIVADAASGRPALSERIIAAHAAWLHDPWHLIAEVAQIVHTTRAGDARATLDGFVEFGRAFGDWMPYGRYERVVAPAGGDLFLTTVASQHHAQLGLKWTANEHVALKAEVHLTAPDVGSLGLGARLEVDLAF